MNPRFLATLSYKVRPGVLVVCVSQYTRLHPASFAHLIHARDQCAAYAVAALVGG